MIDSVKAALRSRRERTVTFSAAAASNMSDAIFNVAVSVEYVGDKQTAQPVTGDSLTGRLSAERRQDVQLV